ncbi:MAG: ABC transporter substrate-binding protein [Deltaproteobacteria bacterium]|jgi:branched-chain amino acid transport system substrate-binding protein|nr:ABC transporter substrate-binding protein [Deltaproteobacteria bacterium]
MMFKKKMLVSVIAVWAVLCIAQAAPAAPPAGFDDNEIRIGQWGPQTGPAAPWGSVARGSKLLFDIVNEEGGINGRKIKYFIRDDMYNPAQTVGVVKELVERQGVFAFVGGVGAACGMAVKDYLAANKIPWVGPSAADQDFIQPLNPYLFAVYPLYRDEANVLAQYIVEKLNMKKVGMLYQNDAYGKDGLEGAKERLATYKMSLVAEIPVEPTEKDLASQILRLKNSGAEAVLMFVNPTAAVIALKTAANVGFKPQWISSNTLSDYPLMFKISGGLWEGVITGAFGEIPDSTHPLMVKYREAAKRLNPQERWGTFYSAGILFADPLVEALKKAGRNLSTEAVMKALNSIKDYQTIGPKINWTEKQHQGTDSVMIQKCGPNASYIQLQGWTTNDLATWKKK